jgi:hypothetical protein
MEFTHRISQEMVRWLRSLPKLLAVRGSLNGIDHAGLFKKWNSSGFSHYPMMNWMIR